MDEKQLPLLTRAVNNGMIGEDRTRRITMRRARMLVVGITLLVIPALVQSQGPGGGMRGGGGPGGGRGGFNFDPDQIFNMMAKGKDTNVIAELDGFQKMMAER